MAGSEMIGLRAAVAQLSVRLDDLEAAVEEETHEVEVGLDEGGGGGTSGAWTLGVKDEKILVRGGPVVRHRMKNGYAGSVMADENIEVLPGGSNTIGVYVSVEVAGYACDPTIKYDKNTFAAMMGEEDKDTFIQPIGLITNNGSDAYTITPYFPAVTVPLLG